MASIADKRSADTTQPVLRVGFWPLAPGTQLLFTRRLSYFQSWLPHLARFPPVPSPVPGSAAATLPGQKCRWPAACPCEHLRWFREAVRHPRPPRGGPRARDSDLAPGVVESWDLHSRGLPFPSLANTSCIFISDHAHSAYPYSSFPHLIIS